MSARESANFLTRATAWLAVAFVALCIIMAVLAARNGSGGTIDTSLKQSSPITRPQAPAPQSSPVPLGGGEAAASNAQSLGEIASNAAERSGQAVR